MQRLDIRYMVYDLPGLLESPSSDLACATNDRFGDAALQPRSGRRKSGKGRHRT